MKISFVPVLKHGLLYERRFVGFTHLCVSYNDILESYVIPATRLNTCMQACTLSYSFELYMSHKMEDFICNGFEAWAFVW